MIKANAANQTQRGISPLRITSRLSLAAPIVALSMLVSANLASAQKTETIEGGRTTVALASSFLSALGSLDVTPGTVGPTRLTAGQTQVTLQSFIMRRALAFVTSAYSSYSGCRQYHEDVARAQEAAGEGAPVIDKLRAFYNHPGFVEAVADRMQESLAKIPQDRREAAHLIYTAHSIPMAMARGCDYEKQLRETCRLVAEKLGRNEWRLVYQSRSGPSSQPWLEPDILNCLREIKEKGGSSDVVISPIGFVSDHMEILFDLDTEAAALCAELGLHMVRAGTVGTHPRFIRMIRELICERIDDNSTRLALGVLGPRPDICPSDCCLMPKWSQAGAA